MQTFDGIITEIIYNNDDNGYAVCEFTSVDETFTITGCLPLVSVGDKLRVSGDFVVHMEYGEQLSVKYYEKMVPEGSEEIYIYLASGAISGVKEATAKRIIDRFGDDTLNIIRDNPEKLALIKGISEEKAIKIHNQYIEQIGVQQVISFLGQYGINTSLAFKVYNHFGSTSVEKVKSNPYCVCEINGIGFAKADMIASSMGFAANSPERTGAAILHVLAEAVSRGHTYLPSDLLIQSVGTLIAADSESVNQQIAKLIIEKKIFRRPISDTESAIYLPALYTAETGCANMILQLAKSTAKKIHYSESDFESDITLAPEQLEGVKSAMENRITVITGGPGTGKTTLLNTVISILKKQDLEIALCAPTGRAAKRMGQLCGMEAKTIHRLLEMSYSEDESRMTFGKNEFSPLEADFVIVDEMSMVDILLMYHLLKALSHKCRIILVGDSDQLPSVGAGNVLRDILASEKTASVKLTKIFRQAGESMITQNAHRINAGDTPICNGEGSDFFFLPRYSATDGTDEIVRLCLTRLPGYLNRSPMDCVQVLCPSRKGNMGTENLNNVLQKAFNPPAPSKKELKRKGFVLREGDKIMQIRNNYYMDWFVEGFGNGCGIFNGDLGIIEKIDTRAGVVTIVFDGEKVVDYPVELLDDIELSYAITVHKSQGSEFTAVVMPMYQAHRNLMTRNLFYTAVTRAKELVALVGREDIVQFMTSNNYEDLRYSGLAELLTQSEG
ncbi:MAG: ATP-dependent RecD-like DNA helicase [Clostridia bacterium]|nr:ATP-dependent RecD-like DNA helicase [Clostridia bacterium]